MKYYLRKNPKQLDAFLAKNFAHESQREKASELLDAYIDNLPPDTASDLFDGKLAEIFKMAQLVPLVIKESDNKAILSIKPNSPRIKTFEE